jgi:hypothetical protein
MVRLPRVYPAQSESNLKLSFMLVFLFVCLDIYYILIIYLLFIIFYYLFSDL